MERFYWHQQNSILKTPDKTTVVELPGAMLIWL